MSTTISRALKHFMVQWYIIWLSDTLIDKIRENMTFEKCLWRWNPFQNTNIILCHASFYFTVYQNSAMACVVVFGQCYVKRMDTVGMFIMTLNLTMNFIAVIRKNQCMYKISCRKLLARFSKIYYSFNCQKVYDLS